MGRGVEKDIFKEVILEDVKIHKVRVCHVHGCILTTTLAHSKPSVNVLGLNCYQMRVPVAARKTEQLFRKWANCAVIGTRGGDSGCELREPGCALPRQGAQHPEAGPRPQRGPWSPKAPDGLGHLAPSSRRQE
ncbi:unnamed protein product [Rangifer tarandus platyrhynchus]|uniref:Uncharacterized protein n=2 Tax=Rangifer tarandus platyrhynchus TaxID=3082113 RepID=A0ABN8YDC2_RANTA|nr:unnamed protein product [Rangifer tarandus platyrhynchus]CAI9699901.1 unnamed protein product [Rangifer tarandus platyrhynchus]